MKTFALLLVALCLIVGMSGAAWATQFLAQIDGGNGVEESFTLTLTTFDGENNYDVIEMDWIGGEEEFVIDFVVDPNATHWRVEAAPASWFSNPEIINLDVINFGADNWLDEEFHYIGPLR